MVSNSVLEKEVTAIHSSDTECQHLLAMVGTLNIEYCGLLQSGVI